MSDKNQRRKEQRAKRKADGLCSECDLPALPYLSRCEKHYELHKQSMNSKEYKEKAKEKVKKRKAERRENGQCTNCLNPVFPGLLMCAKHNKQHKENQHKRMKKLASAGKLNEFKENCKSRVQELTKKRKANGLCVQCGLPSLSNKTRCQQHVEEHRAEGIRRANSRLEAGMCRRCGKEPHVKNGQQCETCLLKQTANVLWGKGNKERWCDLLDILKKQNYKCIYTGRMLRVGDNASIDHIMPKSKGGNNEIDNLQWVDIVVNCLKLDQLNEDFCKLIFEIASYLSTIPRII